MPVRLTAFAHLASEIASVTWSVGGLLTSTTRDRAQFYEDHF